MLKAIVPLGSVKLTLLVTEVLVIPPRVTVQEVPVGRPDSEKVTGYNLGKTAVKVIAKLTPAPFTEIEPDDGDAV